jgi:ABC-type uncharacterized transport system substrate-binding protein
MTENIEQLAKIVATLLTIGSSITLAWKGRNKWEPSEQDLSNGAQRVSGLIIAVGVTILWVVYLDLKYFDLLVKATIIFVIFSVAFFLIYGILISTLTYEKKGKVKIIGGYKLRPAAKKMLRSNGNTIQDVFALFSFDTDKTWTRLSRALAKASFTICYLLFMLSGTLSISAAAVIFIVKTSGSKPPKITERTIVNIGFILNGSAPYAQEAMEGFKQKAEELLKGTHYEAHFEQVIGVAEKNHEDENIELLKNLMDKFPKDPDYLITIGTEVTKIAKKIYLDKIPIIFAAITYPIEDGIVSKLEPDDTRGNLSGVAYNDPAKNLLGFLTRAFPNKRLGFIYNPKYIQDSTMLQRLKRLTRGKKTKLVIIETDSTKLSDKQLGMADIFFGRYFLLTRLKEFLRNNNKPFVGNDLLFVKQGAFACVATPAVEFGTIAAEKIFYPSLIQHISLSEMPIFLHRNASTSYNLSSAIKYNITIPKKALDTANFVVR